MKAEIIAVGTELLLGQVVNTNATFLSEELAALGVEVYYQTVVGDNAERLNELLKRAEERSELVVLCGGLGPTEDDLTREVVADYLGRELIVDEQALTKIKQQINGGKRPMTANNQRQALTIKGGQVISNPVGLAIGTLIQQNATYFLLLPGPPGELYPMFRQEAKPKLLEILPKTEQLTSRVLRFFGIGESRLVTELADLINKQKNPTIAPYAKPNEVTLRLTVKADNSQQGTRLLDELEKQVMAKVGTYFYGYGDQHSLAAETIQTLVKYQQTVTSAESLTAGLFQSSLGAVPGASGAFLGGMVTYSNESKNQLLDISEDLLRDQGAVSEACAKAMALAARQKLGADYSISLTGVAGPDLVEGQPVGTVWIGLSSRRTGVEAYCYHFNRDRSFIRQSAVMTALDLLRRQVIAENQG